MSDIITSLDADRADCFNTIDERGGCRAWAEPGEPASEAAADFAHAAAEPPAQQRAQSHAFSIADFSGDLV
jgi:hypothetical protein